MEKEDKKQRKAFRYIILAAVLFLLLLVCVVMMNSYVRRVPVITAKEQLEFSSNSEISINDIVQIECAGRYRVTISASWADGTETELEVDNDRGIIKVGDQSGKCIVNVTAVGENGERRSEEMTITIQ